MVKRLMGRGRSDDNEDTIKKRLRVNQRDAEPVVAYFDKAKKLVRVNCNDTPEGIPFKVSTNNRCLYTNHRQNPSHHRRLGAIVHRRMSSIRRLESL
jgi:hypothetical protein